MWCPKCKTEYVNGVAVCADCGRTLVEELTPDMYEAEDEELIIPKNMEKKLEEFSKKQEEAMDLGTDEPAKVYVKKDYKLEDVKSTAYTFLIIGLGGIIVLALMNLGIIELSMAGYMKLLMTVVMGILFLAFLIIGLKYFTRIRSMQEEADQEKQFTEEVISWFHEHYTADKLDASIDRIEALTMEQKYFNRYQSMQTILNDHYSGLDSSYQDFVLEKIYNDLYPDHE